MPLLTSERRNCEPLKSWNSLGGRGRKEKRSGGEGKKKKKKYETRDLFKIPAGWPFDEKCSVLSVITDIRDIEHFTLTRIFPPLFKTVLLSPTSSFFPSPSRSWRKFDRDRSIEPMNCAAVTAGNVQRGWCCALFTLCEHRRQLCNRSFGRKFFLPFDVSRM